MNISELKSNFASLPPLDPKVVWNCHRLALRRHIANDSLDEFLNWSTIQATMFVGEAPYIKDEFEDLMQDRDLWEPVIQEPGIGNPTRLSYAPWTSGNLVHQAYHIKQWMDATGISVANLVEIEELGGGYGAMALICRRLGFRGRYHIIDLTEFSLLQQFYLHSIEVSADFNKSFDPNELGLFITLFSLSEMSVDERHIPDAYSYLIGYQPAWQGLDNYQYFSNWIRTKPDFEWSNYFNPNFKNHWYLVGHRE